MSGEAGVEVGMGMSGKKIGSSRIEAQAINATPKRAGWYVVKVGVEGGGTERAKRGLVCGSGKRGGSPGSAMEEGRCMKRGGG